MPEPLGASDPRKLGPYTLTKRLGEGELGVVYHGRDRSGTAVAIKLLRSDLEYDPEPRQRFNAAIETAAQVQSPYVARVIESDIPSDRPYIVSEYVDGPSLFEVVPDQGPFHGEVLDRIAVGTARGLLALHRGGLTHQDLKPSNVLLGAIGPCVVDYAIATALHAAGAIPGKTSPAFQAPEQFAAYMTGATVQPAADVFSWASTMVYAATGRGPFGTDAPRMMLINLITEGEPELDGVPDSLREVVVSCLQKSPTDRPSMADVVAQLPNLPELDPPAPEPEPAGPPPVTPLPVPDERPPWEPADDDTGLRPDSYQPTEFPPPPPADQPMPPGERPPAQPPFPGDQPLPGDQPPPPGPAFTDAAGLPETATPPSAPEGPGGPTPPGEQEPVSPDAFWTMPPPGPGPAPEAPETPAVGGPAGPGQQPPGVPPADPNAPASGPSPGPGADGPPGPLWSPDVELDLDDESSSRRKVLLIGLAVVLVAGVLVGGFLLFQNVIGGDNPTANPDPSPASDPKDDPDPKDEPTDDPGQSSLPSPPDASDRPGENTTLPGASNTEIMTPLNAGISLSVYRVDDVIRTWNPSSGKYEETDLTGEPRVSRDGRWLAGVVDDSGEVAIEDRSNGERRTIPPDELPSSNDGNEPSVSSPQWSADSKKLLLQMDEGNGPTGVVVIDVRSLDTRFVPIEDARYVTWNADRSGFVANPASNGRTPDLVFYDTQGNEEDTIENAGWLADDGYGTFSPDGKRLVTYCSKNDSTPRACVFDAKSLEKQRMVPIDANTAPPDDYLLGWYDNDRLLADINLIPKKLGRGVGAITLDGDPNRFVLRNGDGISAWFDVTPA